MSMRYLSKSKYTAFRQCPKNLWLRTYKPVKTQDCLSRGVENICEAAFSWDGNYCAVDILHKQDGGYAIYEVKSSTNSSLAPSDSDLSRHPFECMHYGL